MPDLIQHISAKAAAPPCKTFRTEQTPQRAKARHRWWHKVPETQSGCSRGVTENASNEGKENNAGFALVIRRVAEPGGRQFSHRPVRGVLCYVWCGQWRKGELRHMISTRGCLHLDGVLRLGGTFDSAGFLVFYTLAPWVDRFSHPSRELPTRGGGCASRRRCPKLSPSFGSCAKNLIVIRRVVRNFNEVLFACIGVTLRMCFKS